MLWYIMTSFRAFALPDTMHKTHVYGALKNNTLNTH